MKTSSSILRRHLKSLHPQRYIAVCTENGLGYRVVQALAAVQPTGPQAGLPDVPEYSPEAFRASLLRLIAANDLVGAVNWCTIALH